MKNFILFLALILSLYCLYKGSKYWQEMQALKSKNLESFNQLRQVKNIYQELISLKDDPVDELEEVYQGVNKQVQTFSRVYDIKTSIEFVHSKSDTLLENQEMSRWLGIHQIPVHVNFFDLKALDKYILIFKFLKDLEETNSLEILKINQTGNYVQVMVQIYGRGR